MPDDAAEFAACVKLPAMAKNIQSAADALTSTTADISAVCGTITAAVRRYGYRCRRPSGTVRQCGCRGIKAMFDFFAGEPKMAMPSAGTGNIETVRKPSLLFRR